MDFAVMGVPLNILLNPPWIMGGGGRWGAKSKLVIKLVYTFQKLSLLFPLLT